MDLVTTFGETLLEQGPIHPMSVNHNHITYPNAAILDRNLSRGAVRVVKLPLLFNHALFLACVHAPGLFPIVPCGKRQSKGGTWHLKKIIQYFMSQKQKVLVRTR